MFQCKNGWLRLLTALLVVTVGGCAGDDEWEDFELDADGGEDVGGLAVVEGALSSSLVLSANGTYGASCKNATGSVAGQNWSMSIAGGQTLTYAPVGVAKNNSTCVLNLSELRTSSDTYVADAPVALSSSYAANAALFTSASGGSFRANAYLSSTNFASAFLLFVLVGDYPTAGAGLSQTATGTYDYQVGKDATTLSYWRLEESAAAATTTDDAFTDSNRNLESHADTLGGSWAKNTNASTAGATAIVENNEVRSDSNKKAVYVASAAPGSPAYTVSANVYVRSIASNQSGVTDQAAVIGRASASANTFYAAGIFTSASYECTSWLVLCLQYGWVNTTEFQLWKFLNGTGTKLGSYSATISSGSTHKVGLKMIGKTIALQVSDVDRITYTDSSNAILTEGQAGLLVGAPGGVASTSSTGLHLDNLKVVPILVANDSNTDTNNSGTLNNGVLIGKTGAWSSSRAYQFDGTNDNVSVLRQIQDDFSIELWFYNTATSAASSATTWWSGAGLVDATSATGSTTAAGFGVSVRSDGRVMAGGGRSYACGFLNLSTCSDSRTVVASAASSFNAWHHVVFTRKASDGAMNLYVDGADATTPFNSSTNSTGQGATAAAGYALNSASNLTLGGLQTGSNYFKGYIDEVAVYNTVLTKAQAAAHYTAQK